MLASAGASAPHMRCMNLRAIGSTLRADLNGGTERGKLIRSAGATAGLKLGATVLAFGASLLYARVLGPHGYGLYAYVVAWATLLTIPASLGLPQYLVREGAKSLGTLRQLCRWADRRILFSGLAAAVLMALALVLPQAAGARWLFVFAAPLPLLTSLGSARSALLQAANRIASSQWPAQILRPLVMLAALAILWVWKETLDPIDLIAVLTGATLLPLFANELQLRRLSRHHAEARRPPVRLRAALPFMWLTGLYLLNNRVDLVMLGTLKGAHDAGIYAVSARAAELVSFFLMSTTMVIAPRIALFRSNGDLRTLQRLITAAARRTLLVSLPLAGVLIVAARPLLSYLYGTTFTQGTIALQILAFGQLVSVAAGPTGTILNMGGYERLSTLGVGISAIVNIGLNSLLIPRYGIQGAAIATGTSLVVWNGLLWYWIRSRLRIRPTAIGL